VIWRDFFVSHARRTNATQKGQIEKKNFCPNLVLKYLLKNVKIGKKISTVALFFLFLCVYVRSDTSMFEGESEGKAAARNQWLWWRHPMIELVFGLLGVGGGGGEGL
jgi:hypothetical protein